MNFYIGWKIILKLESNNKISTLKFRKFLMMTILSVLKPQRLKFFLQQALRELE